MNLTVFEVFKLVYKSMLYKNSSTKKGNSKITRLYAMLHKERENKDSLKVRQIEDEIATKIIANILKETQLNAQR